jgi:hypothetical protein
MRNHSKHRRRTSVLPTCQQSDKGKLELVEQRRYDPKRPVEEEVTDARCSAKGDNGISTDRVRCIRSTSRWLASRP